MTDLESLDDLVVRLRNPAWGVRASDSPELMTEMFLDPVETLRDLNDAADEIEWLRLQVKDG